MSPRALSEIASPAVPGSGEPNLTVSPDGRFLLSWIEEADGKEHVLRFAERRAGQPWSDPRTIARGRDWFVNWADFPALVAVPDGSLFAHWLARTGTGAYAYGVRVAASTDGGRTWGAPVVPHRDGTQTEHGFVSLFPWSASEVGIVWLDGRKTAAAAGGHAAHAEMALMHTTLDANGRLGAESTLDGRVCDCCQTAGVRVDDGVVVAYRDRTEGEVRDNAVVRWSEGLWSGPQTLGPDQWTINGCPVNGPALDARGRRVAAAWFTAAQDRSRVRLSFSTDGGRTFAAPITVDDGRPIGRVDVVVLPGGDALVSWLEQAAAGTELRVRRLRAAGQRGAALVVAGSSSARSSGFPRMEWAGGEAVFAWRDPADPPRVRTAVLSVDR